MTAAGDAMDLEDELSQPDSKWRQRIQRIVKRSTTTLNLAEASSSRAVHPAPTTTPPQQTAVSTVAEDAAPAKGKARRPPARSQTSSLLSYGGAKAQQVGGLQLVLAPHGSNSFFQTSDSAATRNSGRSSRPCPEINISWNDLPADRPPAGRQPTKPLRRSQSSRGPARFNLHQRLVHPRSEDELMTDELDQRVTALAEYLDNSEPLPTFQTHTLSRFGQQPKSNLGGSSGQVWASNSSGQVGMSNSSGQVWGSGLLTLLEASGTHTSGQLLHSSSQLPPSPEEEEEEELEQLGGYMASAAARAKAPTPVAAGARGAAAAAGPGAPATKTLTSPVTASAFPSSPRGVAGSTGSPSPSTSGAFAVQREGSFTSITGLGLFAKLSHGRPKESGGGQVMSLGASVAKTGRKMARRVSQLLMPSALQLQHFESSLEALSPKEPASPTLTAAAAPAPTRPGPAFPALPSPGPASPDSRAPSPPKVRRPPRRAATRAVMQSRDTPGQQRWVVNRLQTSDLQTEAAGGSLPLPRGSKVKVRDVTWYISCDGTWQPHDEDSSSPFAPSTEQRKVVAAMLAEKASEYQAKAQKDGSMARLTEQLLKFQSKKEGALRTCQPWGGLEAAGVVLGGEEEVQELF